LIVVWMTKTQQKDLSQNLPRFINILIPIPMQTQSDSYFKALFLCSPTTMRRVMISLHHKFSLVIGVGYGMEMDSYKSQILDGVLVRTKMKFYEPLSQIACVGVSIIFVLNVHIPTCLGSRGKPFFGTVFFIVSANCRLQV
jgi:hypothetical protein